MNCCLIAVVYALHMNSSFSYPLLISRSCFFFFTGTHTVNRTVKGRTCVRFLTLPWFPVLFFFFFREFEALYKSYSCQGRSFLRFLTQLWFPVYIFFSGTQTLNLKVASGGPLPFAYDILTNAFQYGNRAFTQYPTDIPDYFKQTFPDGYSWERTMEFEDGAKCEVKSVIRLVTCKTCNAHEYFLSHFRLWYIIAFMPCYCWIVSFFLKCFKLELRKA